MMTPPKNRLRRSWAGRPCHGGWGVMIGRADYRCVDGCGAEVLRKFSDGRCSGVNCGAGGGDVVDQPDVFAGEGTIGAAEEGAVEIVLALARCGDFGLGERGANTFQRSIDGPLCEAADFAREFFRLVESPAGAAPPVEGDWDQAVNGGGGAFGDSEDGLIEEGGEDSRDLPGAA